jgi:CDP-diglyceride synthetase
MDDEGATTSAARPIASPYKEWLGMVGSMVLAVLVCAFLFSTGVFS